ncbi:succinoglycan biosynthesis protein exop [Rhizobium mesosinicum]|uniref:Succinoglycan biosynthesis protein exop n=1 Tax=Rhizobium mesosinicum TaxID=335017 RepID=A0ABS7GPT5_9HYPH|nr:succinoglycan biosynthesis protein exop [Rhizobium mesosinicum]MBW9051717.1 succinoglycan biosynthesis protein exop [Rhizobium mesosinicum]
MHDSRAKSSFHNRATRSSRGQRQSHAEKNTHLPEILPSEAELLRAIGRLLDEQRAKARQTEPLVDRIETILGSRLQAANDIASASAPEPSRPALEPRTQFVQVHRVAPVEKAPILPVSGEIRRPNWSRSALVVAALSFGGAATPILMPSSPALYTAETTLAVDTGADNRAALVGDTVKRLLSVPVITSAVAALKLDRDPEFAGNSANALGIAFDLLSGSGAAADPASRAEAALKSALAIIPDGRAGTIRLMVTTGDGNKSTRIAMRLSDAVTGGSAAGKAAETATALKKENDQAQAELIAFGQKNGEGNVKVATQLQRQIAGLDSDLKNADDNILTAKEQADKLKAAKLADVLEGSLAPDMISPTLQDLRDRYALAKTALAQLSADLGPRHPRLLQQQSEVDGLKDSIGKELMRLAQNANAAAKAAVDARRQLSDRRNALIAQSRDTGVDLAKLTELREKASAARSRLEEEVSTTGAIGDGRVSVRKPALVLPVSGDSNFGFNALIGGLTGLAAGLGLAFVPRFFRRQPERTPVAVPVQAPILAPVAELVQVPALTQVAEPALVPQAAGEVDALRSQIASRRDRFHAHQVSR